MKQTTDKPKLTYIEVRAAKRAKREAARKRKNARLFAGYQARNERLAIIPDGQLFD